MWEVEDIPSKSSVFIRVVASYISGDGKPRAAAFSNTPEDGDNLSCDWDGYCNALTSRELIGKQKNQKGEYKDPNKFFIWAMNVGLIREIPEPTQKVEHDPFFNNPEVDGMPNNRAHSIIIGRKDRNSAEFRYHFVKAGNWAIPPSK